jgi:hypothetical protein
MNYDDYLWRQLDRHLDPIDPELQQEQAEEAAEAKYQEKKDEL